MSPPHFMGCGCRYADTFAFWAFRDGVRVGLCRRHLDMWLDNADDDPSMEPASLTFINKAGRAG